MTPATVEVAVEVRAGPPAALHVCAISDDEAWRRRRSVSFMLRGLVAGERVLYVDAEASRHAVLRDLRHVRSGIDQDLAGGRLQLRGVEDLYLTLGGFDAASVQQALVDARERALAEGYPGLRVVGTTAWLAASGSDWERWIAYEEEVNKAFVDGTLAGMCVYDREALPAGVVDRLARAHPMVESSPEGPASGTVPGSLQLVGEVDFSTAAHLRRRLADEPTDADLHIDLGRLRFIDVAGLRALVATATSRPTGRKVVLHRPRPIVRRAISALGWDGALTVRVSDRHEAEA